MAGNVYTYQVLKDTTEHVIIKLTGKFDGSGQEENVARIKANSFYGALDANNNLLITGNTAKPYYGLTVHRIWYDTYNGAGGDLELYWRADTPVTLAMLSGNAEYDGAGNWVTIPNNAKGTSGCTGDIGITSRAYAANCSYTIVMELRKENEYYQRGQFNDPAAFNYTPYGLKP